MLIDSNQIESSMERGCDIMKFRNHIFGLIVFAMLLVCIMGPWNAYEANAEDTVKGTSITSISGIDQGFHIRWKRVMDCAGYELSYSESPDFTEAESITFPYVNAYSNKIKGLDWNKKYYVRVRVLYFSNSDDYISSAWSKTKSVTPKPPKKVKVKMPTKVSWSRNWSVKYHYNDYGLVDRIEIGGSIPEVVYQYEYTYYEDGTINTIAEKYYYYDDDDDDSPTVHPFVLKYTLDKDGIPIMIHTPESSMVNIEYNDEYNPTYRRLNYLRMTGGGYDYLENGLLYRASGQVSDDDDAVVYKQYDKKNHLSILSHSNYGIKTYKYKYRNGRVSTRTRYDNGRKDETAKFKSWKTVTVYNNAIRSLTYLAPFLNINEDLNAYPYYIYKW